MRLTNLFEPAEKYLKLGLPAAFLKKLAAAAVIRRVRHLLKYYLQSFGMLLIPEDFTSRLMHRIMS